MTDRPTSCRNRLRERWGPYAYDHLPIELDAIEVSTPDQPDQPDTVDASYPAPRAPNPSTPLAPVPSAKRVHSANGPRRRYGFLHRPRSRPERLILEFHPNGCCNAGTGVNEMDAQRIPPEIEMRGVSNDEWVQWMNQLTHTVQSKQTCGGCWIELFAWILILPLFWLYYQRSQYQRALKHWLTTFNTQVLEQHGMYASTQTAIFHVDKYHEEISWLAIATTSDEITSLRDEVHIWKYQMGSPACLRWCCRNCPQEDRIVPIHASCQYSACCCGPQRMV